ncbi:Leucine-rich repeat-containing protein 1 (LANO adapter protein) (LAP and no PDZ protein) [Durusdinium trenchii]|uniref:Leucine-rich repeat-containing protein 1 (LANO adapter protein) (LAP and no PDZ protein) n=1 Tax=Durusdinium trenchii TaxID=1381693 RepID=A0ABP0NQJ1_9DINO
MDERSTCGICQTPLNPQRWAQAIVPDCQHGYHLNCMLQAAQGDDKFECATCEEFRSSPREGLRLLLEECSEELHKRDPTDIEFSRAEEIKRGREMIPMHQIPSCVLSIQGLRCLDFTGHPLERLPPEIQNLKSLTRLVLCSTNLRELPVELCELRNLQQLVVACCPIRRLPEQLCNLVRLWDFYFDGNQLVEMPASFPPLLNGIKVSGNLLKELPDGVGRCHDVKAVRAYANQLRSLPDSICELAQATEMSLQGNRLELLPSSLGSLQQLQYLSLHDNNLRALPASMVHLEELRWLYLYNNQLQDLPKGVGRLKNLERLLVEANPFSKATLEDLAASQGPQLRLLGLDAVQVATHPAPPWASVGWMLPWGKLYAKLQPASQLKRPEGVNPVKGARPQQHHDVLVVAFAASQGEPEWLGVLSQVHAGQVSVAEAEAQISLENLGTFSELHRRLHGTTVGDGEDEVEQLASTAWLLAPPHHSGRNGEVLEDFDVLSLCDTAAQWYADTAEREQLHVESKLKEIAQEYRRVILLGVSMGGFGALSNSHLANSVLVFGPQTDSLTE